MQTTQRPRSAIFSWAVLALACGVGLSAAGCSGTPTPAGSSAPPALISTPASPAQYPFPDPAGTATTGPLTVYYIAIGDNGASGPRVGCGDSAVAVSSAPVSYSDPVAGALSVLLANHSVKVGQSGLDNTLWQSRLALDSVNRGSNAVVVSLRETLTQGGECDSPRIEQQLLLTARTAAKNPVTILLNGKPLAEALSLK